MCAIDKVQSNNMYGISKSLRLPESILGPNRTITNSDYIHSFTFIWGHQKSLFTTLISQMGSGSHNYLSADLKPYHWAVQ